MFRLIKQLFYVLLSFSSSLAHDRTKYLTLNDELCMVRPTLINLNPVEPKYYSFMISLDKCNASCNVLSPKICAPKKTKDISVKVFNMITDKNEAKTITKHISCDCKCKFNSTPCNSNQKWNHKTCHVNVKIIVHAKRIINIITDIDFINKKDNQKDYSWNPSTRICKNGKYLKSIADTSVITCDEIICYGHYINKNDKMKNTIATNVSINSNDEKVKDCHIAIILLFIIIII